MKLKATEITNRVRIRDISHGYKLKCNRFEGFFTVDGTECCKEAFGLYRYDGQGMLHVITIFKTHLFSCI